MSRIEIFHDSVVLQEVDAIVNAANVTLLGGGGVDGAIHDAAGPDLYWHFHNLGCTCQPGEAIESPGFALPAKHIIHTVGPVWHGGDKNEPQTLAMCYSNCLDEAVAYKWPLENITTNKASGGDRIPVELFQILKDDAVKVLHSIYQQICKIHRRTQTGKPPGKRK